MSLPDLPDVLRCMCAMVRAPVSGYQGSGLSQEDWEARHLLRQVLVMIEERWPGRFPRQTGDLASLCELIEEESG